MDRAIKASNHRKGAPGFPVYGSAPMPWMSHDAAWKVDALLPVTDVDSYLSTVRSGPTTDNERSAVKSRPSTGTCRSWSARSATNRLRAKSAATRPTRDATHHSSIVMPLSRDLRSTSSMREATSRRRQQFLDERSDVIRKISCDQRRRLASAATQRPVDVNAHPETSVGSREKKPLDVTDDRQNVKRKTDSGHHQPCYANRKAENVKAVTAKGAAQGHIAPAELLSSKGKTNSTQQVTVDKETFDKSTNSIEMKNKENIASTKPLSSTKPIRPRPVKSTISMHSKEAEKHHCSTTPLKPAENSQLKVHTGSVERIATAQRSMDCGTENVGGFDALLRSVKHIPVPFNDSGAVETDGRHSGLRTRQGRLIGWAEQVAKRPEPRGDYSVPVHVPTPVIKTPEPNPTQRGTQSHFFRAEARPNPSTPRFHFIIDKQWPSDEISFKTHPHRYGAFRKRLELD